LGFTRVFTNNIKLFIMSYTRDACIRIFIKKKNFLCYAFLFNFSCNTYSVFNCVRFKVNTKGKYRKCDKQNANIYIFSKITKS
jgi:hypothetical protein